MRGTIISSTTLAGIKIIAILGMICYHAGLIEVIDYGTIACSFFFVVSGFTTAYYHFDNWEISSESVFLYYKKKIKAVFLPYYLAFFISIPIVLKQVKTFDDLFEAFFNGIFHILFIQCWFPNITFKYNAVAWFTGALMFCYFITPIIILLLRKINSTNRLFISIFILITFHFFLEYCSKRYPLVFSYSMHSNPAIKAIEYIIGMQLSLIYLKVKDKGSKFFYTILEVASIVLLYGISLFMGKDGFRSLSLIPLSMIIIIFSLGKGYISNFFSLDCFSELSKLQGYLYLFHYVIISYLSKILEAIKLDYWYNNKILFSILSVLFTIAFSKIIYLANKRFRIK